MGRLQQSDLFLVLGIVVFLFPVQQYRLSNFSSYKLSVMAIYFAAQPVRFASVTRRRMGLCQVFIVNAFIIIKRYRTVQHFQNNRQCSLVFFFY